MTLRPISDARRDALLREARRAIMQSAERAAAQWVDGPRGRSDVAKAIAEASEAAVFRLLCVIDGVGDPDGWNDGAWMPIRLADRTDDGEYAEMLHDRYFELAASTDSVT